jgi:hypothetical protein
MKLYINNANESVEDELKTYVSQQLAASDAIINSHIDTTNADMKLYIDKANESVEDELKTYVSQQLAASDIAINSHIDSNNAAISSSIAANNTAITSIIASNNAEMKSYINTSNSILENDLKTYVAQQITASDVAINSHIDSNNTAISSSIAANNTAITSIIASNNADMKSYINTSNSILENDLKSFVYQEVTNSEKAINSHIDSNNAAISSSIAANNTAITSIIASNNADMKSYIDNKFITSDQNIITQLSGQIAIVQSSIAGLINATKAEIEAFMQTITTSNSNIFTLLTSISANGGGGNNNNNSNVQDAMMHSMLISDAVTNIMGYYSDLISGKYTQVSSAFTREMFNNLTAQLNGFKSTLAISSDYEVMRGLILNSLTTVYNLLTQNNSYLHNLMNYDKLYNIIVSTFKTYITEFNAIQYSSTDLNNDPNYTALLNNFTQTEAVRLGQLLISNNFNTTFTDSEISAFINSGNILSSYSDSTPIFDLYRSFIYLLIDTLNGDLTLLNYNKNCQSEITDLSNYKNILTNISLLQDYINLHYSGKNVALYSFNITSDVTSPVVINPAFIEYNNLYGAPSNNVFNSEELNQIIYNDKNNQILE